MSRRIILITTVLLLIVACGVDILLAAKVKRLNATIEHLRREDQLLEGAKVPPIIGKALSGEETTIRFSESSVPTILYIFSPTCGWCHKNERNVRAITANTNGRFRLIGLSLSRDGLEEYLKKTELPMTVYTDIPFDVTSAYKLGATPETIVVSPEGKVLKIWRGAYEGGVLREVEAYFGLSLPGLSARMSFPGKDRKLQLCG
jgi:hypothetical protein